MRRVAWNGPAFRAGLAPGAVLKSLNGAPYSDARLKPALGRSKLTLGYGQDGADRTAIMRNVPPQTRPVLRANGERPWLFDILKSRAS